MQKPLNVFRRNERGFSLMELLVVLGIIMIVSAIAVTRMYTGKNEIGGAERVLEDVSARIVERRAAAVRLNGEDRRSLLENFEAAPLSMNFEDLATTGTVKTEGVDEDRNCIDDVTGETLTCLNISGGNAVWSLVYAQDVLKLPDGWRLADVGRGMDLPRLGGGNAGQGVPVRDIAFDQTGKAFAKEAGSGVWQKQPTGSGVTDSPSTQDAPFWAVYFVMPGIEKNTVSAGVAVAVHPSGLIERFRWDGEQWMGFKNRTIKGKKGK